ncbi:DnaJ domain-containing protein [Cordyceps javanica]|uniref:DnaJ domain-containing protein n=1 Tax=Cordyceps javanica TaxID=43265 RepID=A0A545VIF0_9HYPO|nr:DnaJ domain-containing protein [Cordyceps javanica]TQW01509.1 DnaJ domain containing protein [Cordyceps javanica]
MATLHFTVDYYAVLQISDEADASTIKAAYKRLALAKHPDRNRALNATADFQKVQAYEVLKDRDIRKYFDAELPRIRHETAGRALATSKSELNCAFDGQTPQFYEQAIYVQKQKLQDLTIERATLIQARDVKFQEIYKHTLAVRRLQAEEDKAVGENIDLNIWYSFLRLRRYSRSQQEQRNRVAALRLATLRDIKDILRDLTAQRDDMSAKILSLDADVLQVSDKIEQHKQAAAHATAEEKYRQQVRKRQDAEERAKRQREEQLGKVTAEGARKQKEEQMRTEAEQKRKRQFAKAQARKQRERQLKQEMEELTRKEKEGQRHRDIQQRMVWEAEVRFAKERHRLTKAERQRADSTATSIRTRGQE